MRELRTVVHKNSRTNDNGNTIVDGFSCAGWTGTEFSLIDNLLNLDFKEFYYSAPYYWGYINAKDMLIFTYTEGDTTLVQCKDKLSFVKEIKDYIKFLKESGQAGTYEAELVLKRIVDN